MPCVVPASFAAACSVEQFFFDHWYAAQPAATQARMQALVASGQLVFINGGYCMHDEAAPTYVDMLDQTTLGESPHSC